MKRRSINKLILGALVFGSIMSVAGSVNAFAAQQFKKQFVCNNGEWSYYKENGQIARDETIVIDGKEYKFDKDGKYILSEKEKEEREKMDQELKLYEEKYPETNECSEEYKKRDDRWCNKNGNWYFNFEGIYKDEGRDEDEWDLINGYWYHFNKDGIMERNITIKDEKGNDCVLNSDGVLINREKPEFDDVIENFSLKVIDGNSYFINKNGKKATGWIMFKGKWYYMNNDGVMQKNKTIIEGSNKYVLGADGAWIK